MEPGYGGVEGIAFLIFFLIFFYFVSKWEFFFPPLFYCNKEAIPQKFNIIVRAGNIYIYTLKLSVLIVQQQT